MSSSSAPSLIRVASPPTLLRDLNYVFHRHSIDRLPSFTVRHFSRLDSEKKQLDLLLRNIYNRCGADLMQGKRLRLEQLQAAVPFARDSQIVSAIDASCALRLVERFDDAGFWLGEEVKEQKKSETKITAAASSSPTNRHLHHLFHLKRTRVFRNFIYFPDFTGRNAVESDVFETSTPLVIRRRRQQLLEMLQSGTHEVMLLGAPTQVYLRMTHRQAVSIFVGYLNGSLHAEGVHDALGLPVPESDASADQQQQQQQQSEDSSNDDATSPSSSSKKQLLAKAQQEQQQRMYVRRLLAERMTEDAITAGDGYDADLSKVSSPFRGRPEGEEIGGGRHRSSAAMSFRDPLEVDMDDAGSAATRMQEHQVRQLFPNALDEGDDVQQQQQQRQHFRGERRQKQQHQQQYETKSGQWERKRTPDQVFRQELRRLYERDYGASAQGVNLNYSDFNSGRSGGGAYRGILGRVFSPARSALSVADTLRTKKRLPFETALRSFQSRAPGFCTLHFFVAKLKGQTATRKRSSMMMRFDATSCLFPGASASSSSSSSSALLAQQASSTRRLFFDQQLLPSFARFRMPFPVSTHAVQLFEHMPHSVADISAIVGQHVAMNLVVPHKKKKKNISVSLPFAPAPSIGVALGDGETIRHDLLVLAKSRSSLVDFAKAVSQLLRHRWAGGPLALLVLARNSALGFTDYRLAESTERTESECARILKRAEEQELGGGGGDLQSAAVTTRSTLQRGPLCAWVGDCRILENIFVAVQRAAINGMPPSSPVWRKNNNSNKNNITTVKTLSPSSEVKRLVVPVPSRSVFFISSLDQLSFVSGWTSEFGSVCGPLLLRRFLIAHARDSASIALYSRGNATMRDGFGSSRRRHGAFFAVPSSSSSVVDDDSKIVWNAVIPASMPSLALFRRELQKKKKSGGANNEDEEESDGDDEDVTDGSKKDDPYHQASLRLREQQRQFVVVQVGDDGGELFVILTAEGLA